MSEIISVPLNKQVHSERNVRKTGGKSIDDLAAFDPCSRSAP